jgi:long-chain acyl-CoA synthetase
MMRPHLVSFLDDMRRFGGDIAIVRYVGNRRRLARYAEIAVLAGRVAALLVQRNLQQGDRVLLWAENSAEWVAVFYGCMLRGVLAVPLDAYGAPEFAGRVAANVRPSLVVGDAALLRTLPGAWPKLSFEDLPAVLPAGQAGPVAGLSRETPLQILFTSGTTGEPKGIVHTHGNVLASVEPIEQGARGYMRYEGLVHPLRFLHTLPLSHVFGQMMGLWVPAIFAAEVHFESRPAAPWLVRIIRQERISVLASVPRVLAMLQRHLEAEYPGLTQRVADSKGFSSLKRWWRFRDIHTAFGLKFWAFISGGGALPGPVEQFWNALGFVLVQGYGMTETAALITLNHPFHVARGTIGKPLPGREIRLGPDGEVLVRGPMISTATWSGGALHPRAGEWLATGDLAETQPTGELRFLGRKSEVIVTGTGVNIHPEDLEAALERQPEVTACAVVGVETPSGPEPCAVLALRGAPERAAAIIENANAGLAEFQHIRRWLLWPEPDLPRTSTGKVRRAAVAAWVAGQEAADKEGTPVTNADWLLALIVQTTGEAPPAHAESTGAADALRLEEDLRLDSLGRVQLLATLEERLEIALDSGRYAGVRTLGELRRMVGSVDMAVARADEPAVESARPEAVAPSAPDAKPNSDIRNGPADKREPEAQPLPGARPRPVAAGYVYPRWPWLLPMRWLRAAFVECVMRPLVWLLAAPRIVRTRTLAAEEPMLIIANHVTAYDVPLLLSALPPAVRDRTTVAMSGEMLEDYRHARNMEPRWLNLLGPPAWLLITALFNVFPLPRQRDFQRSFAHAGEALDRGFHVIVFPEGTRSPDGALARFRPGIGLLVKQSHASVLPMAIHGLGKLKTRQRGWFRSGAVAVCVGQPIRFSPDESEAAITARLHAEVEKLLVPQA